MIDTHSHIYESKFDSDRDEVISRSKAAGIKRILIMSCTLADAAMVRDTTAAYPDTCFALYGLHPTEMGEKPMEEAEAIMDFAESNGLPRVGVGEIGLDLHWDKGRKDEQVEVFEWQMRYAYDHNLPVSIHCRDAVWLLMECLERMGGHIPAGSLHCFTGSVDEAKVIARKWPQLMFGFGGSCTYKNSRVAEVAAAVPFDRILTETDAPYLTPVPHRGERNEPSFIPFVVEKLAQTMGRSAEEVAHQTHENAMRLFFFDGKTAQ